MLLNQLLFYFSWDTFDQELVPCSTLSNGHTCGCAATTKGCRGWELGDARMDAEKRVSCLTCTALWETIKSSPHSCKTRSKFSYPLCLLSILPFRPPLVTGMFYPSNLRVRFGHLESYFSCNIGTPVKSYSIIFFPLDWSLKKKKIIKKMALTKCIFAGDVFYTHLLNDLYMKLLLWSILDHPYFASVTSLL